MNAKLKSKQEPLQPHILRAHRLMDAFAKSDDERDFYLDRLEGFIIYVDLDKSPSDLEELEKELAKHPERYCMIPKLTFYETKKIMEGFVTEKVYDIDTKEKLIDIIQSKEARANFLEFIYDHLSELEKWQQYYQERSRIRIIEWLRQNHFHFVFEEDLEFVRSLLEKLKQSLFDSKVNKDILAARKLLIAKAKTYYSNEALNPRPKRGRPPKQAIKQEIEPQLSSDVYLTAPTAVRPFLFIPDISNASAVTFSASFDSEGSRRAPATDSSIESFQQKLATLRSLSKNWVKPEPKIDFDKDDDEEDFDDEADKKPSKLIKKPVKGNIEKKKTAPAKSNKKPPPKLKPSKAKSKVVPQPTRKSTSGPVIKANSKSWSTQSASKKKHKRIMPVQKAVSKAKPIKKAAPPAKKVAPKKIVSKTGSVKTKARPMQNTKAKAAKAKIKPTKTKVAKTTKKLVKSKPKSNAAAKRR